MATAEQIRLQLVNAVELVVGRISADLIEGLSAATPRDTSYHASRWVGRAGGPPASRTTPNSRSGRAASISFGQQSESISSVRRFSIGDGSVFIGNDGNFIEQLNNREGDFVTDEINRAINGVSLLGTGLRRR